MLTTNQRVKRSSGRWFCLTVALTIVLLFVVAKARLSFADESAPRTFSSPAQACQTLLQAVQNEDEQALEAILGAGREVTSSSDDVQDRLERERFRQKYEEMHRLVQEPDGNTVLYIGAENWPFPIPLVSKDGAWHFDSAAGEKEVRFRRIGENEQAAIQSCQLLAIAERQHKTTLQPGDPVSQYAQRFASTEGRHDGLYWPGGSQAGSTIPAFLARAGDDGTASQDQKPVPFGGYYFRILKRQGKKAPAGAMSYISDGRMTGGFAFVAYPAEYRSSGVVTFMVSQDQVVYEKDLGPDTTSLADAMTEFNPDSTWNPVAEQ